MRQTVSLTGQRTLLAAYSRSASPSQEWIVYLPESGAGFHKGSRAELKQLLGARLAAKFNFLVINKPGVGPRATDKKAFERSFRRHFRVRDAITTMKAIIPQSHKIYLIGYSEGAYLAPEIASLDSRVKALALIGGGTRGWLKEELNNATPRERSAIRKQILEIRKQSESTQKWHDFSYATWHSYREDRTLQALKKIRRPTLAIFGGRDKTIDLKAALSDLRRLSKKKPIQIEVLPRCGHSFNGHWEPVSQYLTEFLSV